MENNITREDSVRLIDKSIKSISSNLIRLKFAIDIIKPNIDKYDNFTLAVIKYSLDDINDMMLKNLPIIEEAVGYSYKNSRNE